MSRRGGGRGGSRTVATPTPTPTTMTGRPPPSCKLCGAALVERVSRTAANPNRRFWSCMEMSHPFGGWIDPKGVQYLPEEETAPPPASPTRQSSTWNSGWTGSPNVTSSYPTRGQMTARTSGPPTTYPQAYMLTPEKTPKKTSQDRSDYEQAPTSPSPLPRHRRQAAPNDDLLPIKFDPDDSALRSHQSAQLGMLSLSPPIATETKTVASTGLGIKRPAAEGTATPEDETASESSSSSRGNRRKKKPKRGTSPSDRRAGSSGEVAELMARFRILENRVTFLEDTIATLQSGACRCAQKD
ncbi:hypothetical protein DFJ73DRAFT_825209 [Zopfochytrium polystomum]|nr:hypothetical protein DFJ73DRAFT_825209 [Zopfochytrium polystomum]